MADFLRRIVRVLAPVVVSGSISAGPPARHACG
jgi:hypothetical protein